MTRSLYTKFLLGYLVFGLLGFIFIATMSSEITYQYLLEEKSESLYDEANLLASTYSDIYQGKNISLSTANPQLQALVLVHAADMEADKQPAVRIQQFGEHTVIHFRCADLQKGHGTEFIRHRELPCFTEAEGRWCDKILNRQAGRGKPAPFKGKPFPVRV